MTGFEAVVNTAPSLRAQRSNPAFCLRAEADFLVANVGSAKLDCFVASLPAQTQRVCRRQWRDSRLLLTPRRHVWTAPCRQGFFGVSANGSGSGHVYGLEMRPVAAGPDGERGSNSNHCGALLRAMTVRSVLIPVS